MKTANPPVEPPTLQQLIAASENYETDYNIEWDEETSSFFVTFADKRDNTDIIQYQFNTEDEGKELLFELMEHLESYEEEEPEEKAGQSPPFTVEQVEDFIENKFNQGY